MTPGMQVLMKQMEELWDRYCLNVFDDADAETATSALSESATVLEIPSMIGGTGRNGVRRYLADTFLPSMPKDIVRERLTRTIDTRKLVDEAQFTFTHDRVLPWLLPGVAPTRRRVTVLAISIVRIQQNRIDTIRTLWDQAGLRGRLPTAAPRADRMDHHPGEAMRRTLRHHMAV